MKAPGINSDMLNDVDAMFADKKEVYISQPSQFLDDVYKTMEGSFMSLNENPAMTGAVRVRCMVQEAIGTNEFFIMSCNLKTGENTRPSTMLFRDSLQADEEIVSHDGFVSRCSYVMVDVPGATPWYKNHFKSSTQPITEEIPCKKSRVSEENVGEIPKFLAKFVGEESDYDLPINTVIDLYGLLTEARQTAANDEEEPCKDAPLPIFHVLKHEIVHTESLANPLATTYDMTVTGQALCRKLTSLLGDSTSAEWLMLHLMSTTYARPNGMPVCCLPLNVVGINDSTVIVDVIKQLMPKVKVLSLTPSLLSDKPFASFKDYIKSDFLTQGELQLSSGTLLIIDETGLPEGKVAVGGYAEANLRTLEQLIIEQRIIYQCATAMIPFDVDYPMLILSKNQSRLFKTPFQVPMLPGMDQFVLGDHVEKTIYRQYILTARNNVKQISITGDTAKGIQESFVELCKNLPQSTEKSDLLNELLIVSRLLTAAAGCSELQPAHFARAVEMERSRKENMTEWTKMQK